MDIPAPADQLVSDRGAQQRAVACVSTPIPHALGAEDGPGVAPALVGGTLVAVAAAALTAFSGGGVLSVLFVYSVSGAVSVLGFATAGVARRAVAGRVSSSRWRTLGVRSSDRLRMG